MTMHATTVHFDQATDILEVGKSYITRKKWFFHCTEIRVDDNDCFTFGGILINPVTGERSGGLLFASDGKMLPKRIFCGFGDDVTAVITGLQTIE